MVSVLMLAGNINNSGGTERVSSLVANGLSEKGYNVILASITGGDKPFFPLNNKVKTISLSKKSGRVLYRTPNIIFQIRSVLKKEKIDILIVVESMSVLFTLPAIIGLPVKHICWEHFNYKNDLGKKGRRIARQLAARYCDAVVTLTERDKSYWLQGTKHKNQITVIPNPSPFVVQRGSYSKDSKIVLAVGRLTHIKGYDLLLEAWKKVIKEAPDWKLKIIGEGEEKKNLLEFILNNNLSNSVDLVGKTNNVEVFYEEAAIFCLSSRYEGFPMVLLETLSFGIPVVSFDCDTGPAELLDGTGSTLVPVNDVTQLALSLVALMGDDDKRKEISRKSKDKAKLYQMPIIIEKWLYLLEK